jgi:HSP20 family protein
MYRRYRFSPVWQDMERLRQEMDHLFDSYYPARYRTAPGYPAMNIWANEDGLAVTAEVPGIHPDDIDISVVGETLTLSGERKPDDIKGDARYHRQERGHGKFTRSIQLPFPVNVNKVEATFKSGVLHISLPRAEVDKPKKILVKAN